MTLQKMLPVENKQLWTMYLGSLVLRDKMLSLVIGTSTKARFTIMSHCPIGLAALPHRDDRIHFYSCGIPS